MEKPILFNTEMVKAILAGQKTSTRRIIKPQPKQPVPYKQLDMFESSGCHIKRTPLERM